MHHVSQDRQVLGAHLAALELTEMPLPTCLEVPDPQFPNKAPAGRRSSCPAPLPVPGGQPDPHPQAGESSGGQLRWARCPDDGLLHLLQPGDVIVAAIGGHAEALCGLRLPAVSLTLINGSAGALCMACRCRHFAREQRSRPEGYPVSSRLPGPPLISADAAASALCDLFLVNADRDDNAANDELVAELLRRIRAQRGTSAGDHSQHATG